MKFGILNAEFGIENVIQNRLRLIVGGGRLSKNICSLLCETKAAFARRKRRKGAGGNLKTEIPPGPPLNLFDQITRLHSPAALVAEDFSIFCMLQKKSSAKSPHSVLLQAFSAAATMNSYFFDKLSRPFTGTALTVKKLIGRCRRGHSPSDWNRIAGLCRAALIQKSGRSHFFDTLPPPTDRRRRFILYADLVSSTASSRLKGNTLPSALWGMCSRVRMRSTRGRVKYQLTKRAQATPTPVSIMRITEYSR